MSVTSSTDRIDRSIDVDAPIERVWQLVSEPGWWINDGALVEHRIETTGDLSTVHDPVHGSFTIQTVSADPPRHIIFRWLGADPAEGSTLVEFHLTDRAAGGVVLQVVESGFDALPLAAADRRRRFDENVEGWRTELALAARRFADTDRG